MLGKSKNSENTLNRLKTKLSKMFVIKLADKGVEEAMK